MYIGGLQKTTLLDFPDRLACIVFTRGCNFRCPYCYNTELIPLPDPQEEEDLSSLWEFLESRKNILDGVCITGGEPLLQKDLPEFLRKVREMGFLIKLDTNGSFPERLEAILQENLVEYLAMDVKTSPENYDRLSGFPGSREKVAASLEILRKGKVSFECRTTLVPRFHSPEILEDLGQWVRGVPLWVLQRFRPGKTLDPSLEKERTFTRAEMEAFRKIAVPYAEKVLLRE
ncbi:MAG TPA: anaerobic ribonucleoside-triphosphate reductase activating protein [Synergistaceae bacterium]|nr:anaerobic ribonucleoside-triphosphate reductase activating protein [Synergistaceae bacterium]HPQ37929.1 anaerobic ribonucleoside-triphosphate reductase activating protein [Synergistaceae bacterium]